MTDHQSLERNLTPAEVSELERERRAALRDLFEWFKGLRFGTAQAQMTLPGLQDYRQASFADLHSVDNNSDW